MWAAAGLGEANKRRTRGCPGPVAWTWVSRQRMLVTASREPRPPPLLVDACPAPRLQLREQTSQNGGFGSPRRPWCRVAPVGLGDAWQDGHAWARCTCRLDRTRTRTLTVILTGCRRANPTRGGVETLLLLAHPTPVCSARQEMCFCAPVCRGCRLVGMAGQDMRHAA